MRGLGGVVGADAARAFVGNSGTTARFLPPVMALGQGVYEIDGVARMRERPIEPLIDSLGKLGVRIEALGKPGCFPLRIHGGTLRGGAVAVAGSASSQYASGLMMAAPAMPEGLTLDARRRAGLAALPRDDGAGDARLRCRGRRRTSARS